MAHELEVFEDGTAAFFSNRQVPWHTLGTVTTDALNAADALKMAQLDWEVFKSEDPVQVPILTDEGVRLVTAHDKFMTYRNHPKRGFQGLGVVGSKYEVIQNHQAFDFLNHLVDESGAVFETAGSMLGGRQVFMSMKMPESVVLGGGQDTVDMYLMATTSHDGTKAFTAAVTPIRPVCANTVRLALGRAVSHWSLKHTTNVQGQIALAREALGVVWAYQKDFSDAAGRLASSGFSEDNFDVFLMSLIKDDEGKTARQERKAESVRSEMRALWNAPTQANIAGTRWAAYNAVVEWADWVKPVRSKDTDKDAVRAARIMSGGVSDLKDRAYRLLAV
jgi:phage/plasmid-like protein (TIGR03299 family)